MNHNSIIEQYSSATLEKLFTSPFEEADILTEAATDIMSSPCLYSSRPAR